MPIVTKEEEYPVVINADNNLLGCPFSSDYSIIVLIRATSRLLQILLRTQNFPKGNPLLCLMRDKMCPHIAVPWKNKEEPKKARGKEAQILR